MAINADKPALWKVDVSASIDHYNEWFMRFAPLAYRQTRVKTVEKVRLDLGRTANLMSVTPTVLRAYPDTLPTLRMSTAPPLARDRLIGLAGVSSNLVVRMETGQLPQRMRDPDLMEALHRICQIIIRLVDQDLFPWLEERRVPSESDQQRSATVVADRLCGAVADPIIRNAQEERQLSLISVFLTTRGYIQAPPDTHQPLAAMQPGKFSFRQNVIVGHKPRINIPIDVVIQPHAPLPGRLPLFIEAKSAGDFTNTNKRRKEEATKIRQLREEFGEETRMILFLCGYFDTGYLGYEAAEGLDWVWEHRIDDLLLAGI